MAVVMAEQIRTLEDLGLILSITRHLTTIYDYIFRGSGEVFWPL